MHRLSFSLLVQCPADTLYILQLLIPVANRHLGTGHFRVVLISRSLQGPEEKHPKFIVTGNQLF